MGGVDKAFVSLAGQSLIDRVIARFSPQVAALAVAANGDTARFDAFQLSVLVDAARLGPLAGILSGLIWAQARGAAAVVSVPVDGPFLPLDLVARLGPVQHAPRLAMAGGRQHPTYGIWPVTLTPALAGFLGTGASPRVRDFAAVVGALWVEFPDAAAFDNLNTNQDLAAARARLTEAGG